MTNFTMNWMSCGRLQKEWDLHRDKERERNPQICFITLWCILLHHLKSWTPYLWANSWDLQCQNASRLWEISVRSCTFPSIQISEDINVTTSQRSEELQKPWTLVKQYGIKCWKISCWRTYQFLWSVWWDVCARNGTPWFAAEQG